MESRPHGAISIGVRQEHTRRPPPPFSLYFAGMYIMAFFITFLSIMYPYHLLQRNKYPLGHDLELVFDVTFAVEIISVFVYCILVISERATILTDISCISIIVLLFSNIMWTSVFSCNINWIEYSVICVIFIMIVVAHYCIRKKVHDNGDAPHYKDKTKNILLSDIGVLAPLMFALVALIHHRLPWIRYLAVGVITAIMFAIIFFDYTMLTKKKYACNMEVTHPEDNGNINHC